MGKHVKWLIWTSYTWSNAIAASWLFTPSRMSQIASLNRHKSSELIDMALMLNYLYLLDSYGHMITLSQLSKQISMHPPTEGLTLADYIKDFELWVLSWYEHYSNMPGYAWDNSNLPKCDCCNSMNNALGALWDRHLEYPPPSSQVNLRPPNFTPHHCELPMCHIKSALAP